jgi:hypothetical protein
MAGRLPAPGNGQTYQLWLTFESGRTVMAGTLKPNAGGFGALVFEADENGPRFQTVRLTLQPPGSTAPSGVPVLLWVRS